MAGVSVALSGAQSLSATTGSDGTYSFDLKKHTRLLQKSPLSRKAMQTEAMMWM